MATCDECGDELDPKRDKTKGAYWDCCKPCLRAEAVGRTKHVHTCEREQCAICQTWRAEKRQQAQPYLLERAVGGWENETLDRFQ